MNLWFPGPSSVILLSLRRVTLSPLEPHLMITLCWKCRLTLQRLARCLPFRGSTVLPSGGCSVPLRGLQCALRSLQESMCP